jgi:hypothetical protein
VEWVGLILVREVARCVDESVRTKIVLGLYADAVRRSQRSRHRRQSILTRFRRASSSSRDA